MAQIDMTGLSETQVQGLQSLTGRKRSDDYLVVIVQYLRLKNEDPTQARRYFLEESARKLNFGRDFLAVDGLEDGVECYSPNIDKFLLIDPNGEYPTQVIGPEEFKVFLRNGATSQWTSGGPDESGFTDVGERLSTFEKPTQYFPGFKCINDAVDSQLRQVYRAGGFNIPSKRRHKS